MAGITGISNLYSQLNSYRLLSSLSTQQIQRIGAVNRTGANRTGSASKQGSYRQYYSTQTLSPDSIGFVQSYQRSMAEMMTAAQSLLKAGSSASAAPMKIDSSDKAVAEVSASWRPAEAAEYTLDVRQLAAAQVNRSQGIDLEGQDLTGDLALQTAAGIFRFQADGAKAGNREALNRLAEEINRSEAGVTAAVQTLEDGKASLTLTSARTGTDGQFAASGSLASLTGLEDAETEAQNAVYTVQKSGSKLPARESTSQTNSVYVDSSFRIKAELKSTGSTKVTAAADSSKTADAIQNLVDRFNSTLTLLNDNADRGEGVLKQMRRMVLPPTSQRSMELAGLSINKDGTMRFDRQLYTKAEQENPSLVREIISGSYGLANGVFNDARQGMSVSSRSLLSQDLKEAQLASIYNPANIMGTYTRNGVYNMSNFYAVNVLMNLMV